ncbi:type IX secretion system periplasmic lipoprotein PorW/SprE [Spirosoma pollinicola]|uniref:Uncharacterized protein n=1 Tax=Spirosoma pollinicola TaxID=2057025 RepID=A0A2K8YV23_9BACT|nr:tetratricopeptide repeat protein [Spirosoma pollinicola]AUD01495.1 hypothetical protein CWM47_06500 [Spirosoma pollinicola]
MSRYLRNQSFLLLTVLILLTGGLVSCSQYSTKAVSKGYHNLTAHFNAYVLARDQINLAEQILFKTRQENYNQLMPILLPVDSILMQPVKPQIDDAIKKASLIPERHQNSKWLDNAYILIGRARLLKQDLPNAIEVFKYVNTKGTNENDKHTALVGLMRAYVEANDYTNALNVSEYLRNQPLNKPNTRDFYLTKAYMHERQGEYATAAGILDATFPVLKKGEATARLHLIAGQLYDQIGQPAKAVDHYRKVLSSHPTYDQSFYANLYAIQSNGLTGDKKRMAQSAEMFDDLLNDRKNEDLKDKVYFTMGLLEARSGRVDKAIGYYSQSIQAAGSNTTQVPYTYLEIGKLYFEKKADYTHAKVYYDSALALMPKQSPDYAALVTRKKTLDDFVLYRTTITTDDSLLALSKLDANALDKVLEKAIDQRQKEDKAQAALAQQIVDRATNGAGNTMPGATNSNLQPNERWVLYNPVALSQGKQEFSVRWGNRPLEDNWRRSNKEASGAIAADNSPINGSTPANSINPNTPLQPVDAGGGAVVLSGPSRKGQKDAMMAKIPFTKEAQALANQRIENALYKLGKLYKFELNKPADAIPTFEQLLTRYPNTLQKPEVYYLLYLSNEQIGQSSPWKEKLLAEYPNTSYARLTGKVVAQTTDSEAQALKTYTAIYELYKANNNAEALTRAETALGSVAGTQLEDKLALLRLLLVGKVKGIDDYRQAISEFVRDYPGSQLLPHVKEMQAAADQLSAKRK